ncbi:MAG: DUF4097 domain-containing protein [Gemmatimonadetes bacterium]|nr:DUF4097 domain-containing protein [Gemmatimonadota bacterium]
MTRFRSLINVALTVVVAGGSVSSAAEAQDRDWCESDDRDARRYCEVREFTLRATGSLEVDAAPNGGVRVEAWDGDEVQVRAKVVGRSRDGSARAEDLVDEITISRSGRIEASGPRTRDRESWSVSYRIRVPASYDLDLHSTNGGIGVDGVFGDLELETTNGGIHLDHVGGDVRAETTNGGLTIELSGDEWDGAGLDARTTNGGITLAIPDGYSADLETETRNGGLSIDFPITVRGRIGKRIATSLGQGGAPLRVVTTNGGVRVKRLD